METRWKTPYHYDLFAGDVGHTLVLGATGSGKSFLLNFLLVSALQYAPRVLILDLGGSYRWLTSFLGCGYLELSPSEAQDSVVRLRPFSLPATERSVQFLTSWIARLLRIGGWEVGGEDTSEIHDRVEDLYVFPPERRTLGGSGADRIVGAIRFRSAPRRCGLCCHDMTPGHGGIRLQGDRNCELAFVNLLR